MRWEPGDGEVVAVRCGGAFATGVAPAVHGRRSYRDTARRDIRGELDGWPEGPAFSVRSGDEQASLHRRQGWAAFGGFFADLAADVLGGHNLSSPPEVDDPPQEPDNEVTDFPVLWADRGTRARTLPWELDPDLCPEGHGVHLVLTDRRLVLLRASRDGRSEVLHTVPREQLARAERMLYSRSRTDLRLTFADGSWTRLTTPSREATGRLVDVVNGDLVAVDATALTAAQGAAVADWTARSVPKVSKVRAEEADPPYFLARNAGWVEARAPYPSGVPGEVDEVVAHFGPDGRRGVPPER